MNNYPDSETGQELELQFSEAPIYHPDPEINRAFELIYESLQPEDLGRWVAGEDGRPTYPSLQQRLANEGYVVLSNSKATAGRVILELQLPSGCTAQVPVEMI